MSDLLQYKDYFASVKFNSDDSVFHGKILGITDLVNFEGSSESELVDAFQEAVEDYFETCGLLSKELN